MTDTKKTSESSSAKKAEDKKSTREAQAENATLQSPSSILTGPTTADLNPAYNYVEDTQDDEKK